MSRFPVLNLIGLFALAAPLTAQAAAGLSPSSEPDRGNVFPADGGILNVLDYGAVPDDGKDDTAAIQAALDAHPNGSRIVYLPSGRYIVTDTLRWAYGAHGGHHQKRTMLVGQAAGHSELFLPAGTPGFMDPQKPKGLIWTGKAPAQRFRNAVRDLTIRIGAGNPGTHALQFIANNQGRIERVHILSDDGQGQVGLDLGHTNEIGPLLVRHLRVDGFDLGIRSFWPVNSVTFEHVILNNQNVYGWHNYHQMVFVRNLRSTNRVPALYNRKDGRSHVTLYEADLSHPDGRSDLPAIRNQKALYAREVRSDGYRLTIDNNDKGREHGDYSGPTVSEAISHRGRIAGLFRPDLTDDTLLPDQPTWTLPVEESPPIPWGDPTRDWVNIDAFGADPTGRTDSSRALQQAIDSGARTVYLPGGHTYRFEDTVYIRGPVQRIIGLEGRLSRRGRGEWILVDGQHPGGLPDSEAVIIERWQGGPITIRHRSTRTLVVSSIIGTRIHGEGPGDLFVDDVSGKLILNHVGQSAWVRQLNTESDQDEAMLINNGGRLWLFGFKTEKINTLIKTTNGGISDVYGVFAYSNQGWRAGVPAFWIEDAYLAVRGISERNFNRDPISLWFRETRNGETRERAEPAMVYLTPAPPDQ
ncbi:MAG: glycosyl hydrolase family 28-related protein [Opitutales bacterium]